MNMIESTSAPNAAYQVLATAVALQVERMSQEELQALVEKAGADLRAENKSLRDRIAQLEKENTRLLHTIGRLEFGEKDWEGFDPKESTISFTQTLAEAGKLLEGYPGDAL